MDAQVALFAGSAPSPLPSPHPQPQPPGMGKGEELDKKTSVPRSTHPRDLTQDLVGNLITRRELPTPTLSSASSHIGTFGRT